MKKTHIPALALALCMCVALAACSDTSGGQTGGASSEAKLVILDTEYAVEDYAICIAKENEELLNDVDTALKELIADGTAQKIIDKYISGAGHDLTFGNDGANGTLIMATNAEFPPYEYYDGDDIVGIDAEIAAAIADKLGKTLIIDDMDFDAVITSVQTGKADMGMAGLTVTDERLEVINFTASYATGVQVVIVKSGSDITSVDDLFSGEKVYAIGVQTATTGDLYATWDLEDAGLATINRYNKGADAVQALVSGSVDCVIIDNEPAKAFVAAHNG